MRSHARLLRFDIFDRRVDPTLRLTDVPHMTRPNDPVMAAEVREIAEQTVAECIEAGSAEIVTEFALPLQSRAMALLLDVPGEHAEEWISWGVLSDDDSPARSPMDLYVDRQLTRALRVPGTDYFCRLARSVVRPSQFDRERLHRHALLTLLSGRQRVIKLICDSLAWLATSDRALDALREDPAGIATLSEDLVARSVSIARTEVRDLPAACPSAAHARLVLRSILAVLSARVDRLSIHDSQPLGENSDDPARAECGYQRLLLNFWPL